MKNDEILIRMKKHYLFFKSFEGFVDQDILNNCIKYMELLFLNLIRKIIYQNYNKHSFKFNFFLLFLLLIYFSPFIKIIYIFFI